MVCNMTVKACLVQVAVLLLLSGSATAQWDLATGLIKPMSGPPIYNPVPWNGACKVTFKNVPISSRTAGSPAWPYAPVRGVDTSQECSMDGFDTTPASTVDVDACFYKNNTDGTFDFWRKERTLAFSKANCYCYALDRFEGDTCQPGYSNNARGRQQYSDRMTCSALHLSVTDDGAVPVSRSEALTGQPAQGHYIVMLARGGGCAPGGDDCFEEDFHFMRKDASGTWSWKLPNMPASDRDLEGRPITNPETAPLPGHYTVCGYYRVEPAKIFLGNLSASLETSPQPGPLDSTAMAAIASYKANPSVKVSIERAFYNPEMDGTPPIEVRTLLAQQAAWERKRGTQAYKDLQQKQLVALGLAPATTLKPTGSSPSTGTSSTSPNQPSNDGSNTNVVLEALQNQLGAASVGGGVKGSVPQAVTGRKLKSFVRM